MSAPEGSIFREAAIKKYLHKQEQGIPLRVASPPVKLFFGVLLLFLLGAMGFAWSIQVPISVGGQGLVLEQGVAGRTESRVVAVLFLLPNYRANIHIGEPARVLIGSGASSLSGTVTNMAASAISPDEARSRFNLQGMSAQVITEPTIIVTISLEPATSMRVYDGSLCDIQIQTGSQSILSLLPGLNGIFGK